MAECVSTKRGETGTTRFIVAACERGIVARADTLKEAEEHAGRYPCAAVFKVLRLCGMNPAEISRAETVIDEAYRRQTMAEVPMTMQSVAPPASVEELAEEGEE